MLNSLANAIDGIVDGDRIVTEKGVISCSLVGRVILTPEKGNSILLGHISAGVPALISAYERV